MPDTVRRHPGTSIFDRLLMGSNGTPINQVTVSTVSLDPPSIAGTTRGSITFTLTGAAVGDFIQMNVPSALAAGLIHVGAAVSAANTVTVYLYNTTGAPIDDAPLTWTYLWHKVT